MIGSNVSLILSSGGNNPTIVCQGVDVPKVAHEIVEDVMRNCGQVCRCSIRLGEKFSNKLGVRVFKQGVRS